MISFAKITFLNFTIFFCIYIFDVQCFLLDLVENSAATAKVIGTHKMPANAHSTIKVVLMYCMSL